MLILSMTGLPSMAVSADISTHSMSEHCQDMDVECDHGASSSSLLEKDDCCFNDSCECLSMALCHVSTNSQTSLFNTKDSHFKLTSIKINFLFNNDSFLSHITSPEIKPPMA
jgi:hypothetical protein